MKTRGTEHRCASRHVKLRANQVIPPAEEVAMTASRTHKIYVEPLNDEMTLKATASLVLPGVVAPFTYSPWLTFPTGGGNE